MSFPTTTRADIIARAKQGFGDGLGVTPYSQDTIKNGYRTDCSGFVSRCLGLTPSVGNAFWGGLNTVTFPVCLTPVDVNSLVSGDIAGELGPGTAGDNGHIYVFDRWYNDDPNNNDFYCWEQYGGVDGPDHTLRTWPYPDVCQGYRYSFLATPVPPVPAKISVEDHPMVVIGRKDAQGNILPDKYLMYSTGSIHHIRTVDTYQSLVKALGGEAVFSAEDFAALPPAS